MPWYVLCTKSRAEFKTAKVLEENGFEVYCPSTTSVTQWSDRKKRVKSPLFNSFVFINIATSSRDKIFDFVGLVRYLFWLGKPAAVKESEIEILKKWIDNDLIDEVRVSTISSGDKIIIANGAFKEQEATVHQISSKRIKLILPLLGHTINVKLSEAV